MARVAKPAAPQPSAPKPVEPPAEEVNGRGHYWWYVAAFIISLGVFVGATMLALTHKATGWEYTWFREINNQSEGFYRLMTIFTFFGSTWMAVISVAAAFFARYYRLAWRMALTIIGAYGVTFFAKHFIERARPGELFDQVHVRMAEHGMGFPSGHTMLITVVALTLLPYLPWKVRWVLPIAIAAVAISRLYLGVHIPLDLVGGFTIGVAAVAFLRILPQKFRTWLHIS